MNDVLQNPSIIKNNHKQFWEFIVYNIDADWDWVTIFQIEEFYPYICNILESNTPIKDKLISHINIYDYDISDIGNQDFMNDDINERVVTEYCIKMYKEKYNFFDKKMQYNIDVTIDEINKYYNMGFSIIENVLGHNTITWDNFKNLHEDLRQSEDIKYYFSQNINITIDIIKDNLDICNKTHNDSCLCDGWDWEDISKNPNITMEDIENNLNLPWNWDAISLNPNMNKEFFMKYRYKLNMNNICINDYSYHKYFLSSQYKKKLVKKFMGTCFQELIEKTCTVARKLNWDEDFMEDCKNDFYEGGREFYLAECRKYT